MDTFFPDTKDCTVCGLDKTCQSPRMDPYGDGELALLIVAEGPGKTEDERNIPLIGKSGQRLSKALTKLGVNMDRDCLRTNVVQCRPPDNRTPTPDEIECCRVRLEGQIGEFKPSLIYALGSTAMAACLPDMPFSPTMQQMYGRVIPNAHWGCWVVPSYHPAFFERQNGRDGFMLDVALKNGLDVLAEGEYGDRRLDPEGYKLVEDLSEVEALLDALSGSVSDVGFDYETDRLSPHEEGARLLTAAFADEDYPGVGYCIPLEHPDARWTKEELDTIWVALAAFMRSDAPKVVHHYDFEESWTQAKGLGTICNLSADTMVRAHILDNRQGITSLGFQVYYRYGGAYKDMVDLNRVAETPLDIVARYNCLDARYTLRLKQDQDREMG